MNNASHEFLGKKIQHVTAEQSFERFGKPHISTDPVGTTYISYLTAGVGFVASSTGCIRAIQFYGEAYDDDFAPFQGLLPEEIQFNTTRQQVHKHLGPSDEEGGDEVIEFLGYIPRWDRYTRAEYLLHIQYTKDCNGIELVTLMEPGWQPGGH
ncbi:hypothetical protein [Symmachiella dynata]|uniref:hypothetical protein n=1 Tax=Symmachiella dynata TaxID=2527995 RepID=UPI00118A33DC|nr:hypothetical protein Pan258_53960 [Symmachiella dynata]